MSSSPSATERHLDAGKRALSLGDRAGAERAFLEAIASAEAAGTESDQLASALETYGHLLCQTKRFGEAIPQLHRALATRSAIVGQDDISLVPALNDLAGAHLARGDAAAEPVLRHMLAVLERKYGPEHPALGAALNGLSQYYLRQNAFRDAEPLLLRLLALHRADGEERPEVATIMARLATVHHALAEHEAAERLLRRVLEIRERTLAPNHFAIATALDALADTCATRGKLDEALGLLERSLDVRERTLGNAHPSVAAVRAKIADLQLQRSDDVFSSGPNAVPTPAPGPREGEGAPHVITRPHLAPELRPAMQLDEPTGLAELPDVPRVRAADPFDRRRDDAEAVEFARGEDRSDDGSLAISILPSGRPLVLPGVERELLALFADDTSRTSGHAPFDEPEAEEERVPARVRGFVVAAAVAVLAFAVVFGVNAMGGIGGIATGAVTDADLSAGTPPAAGVDPAVDSRQVSAGDVNGRHATAADRPTGSAQAGGSTRRSPARTSEESALAPPSAAPRVDLRLDTVLPVFDMSGGPLPADSSLLGAGSPRVTSATSPYAADRRLRVPTLIGDLPTPRYPPDLRRQRVTGEVVVTFLVDTLGRVDGGSFRVVRATDPRFVAPVSAVITELRFLPAQRDDRRVAHTVEMAFRFAP